MKELVEAMAKSLVDQEDQVFVEEVAGGATIVVELRVAKEDLGKVIGKQGRNAEAMRTILTGHASRFKKRAVLEIIEDQ